MYLHYAFAAQSFGSDPSSEGGDLNAYLRRRKGLSGYVPLLLVLVLFVSSTTVGAKTASFIIIDNETGCILEGKNRDDKLPIGGLTNVALAMVTLDWAKLSNTSLDMIAEVPPNASPQGITNPLGLQSGDRITLRDLLYLALLASDSEAAFTIANAVGQKLPNPQQLDAVGNFVSQMNALAAALQMKHTLFLNPNGLAMPPRSAQPYSTVADLARLTRYAYSKSGLSFYVSQKSREIHIERAGVSIAQDIKNTNTLLGSELIDGVKTARSVQTGECIIITSARAPEVRREGTTVYTTPRRIITVLLGSEDRNGDGLNLNRRGWMLYNDWAAAGRPERDHRFLSQ
ncbi:MAG: hypothetical protein A3F67_09555 [Verrucomicrobia bacterium RIFCSPHIGHO2_12_FULL_41_10]|nr:MAG: hypothetical protein A3F67_09555 [Verrucomicrobia bacterium RIFCSPHIGHO2_12_FULL_41_10]HLB33996.1 hypothetical protein [Chthoniobacterales bacterium]